MRKILLILIIVLLIVFGYNVLFNGLNIGNLTILSVKQIQDNNEGLEAKIEDLNKTIDTDYPKAISEVNNAVNRMNNAKSEYIKYTNLSSDEQIRYAMQNTSYTIEFLWLRLGTHATKQGVNLKFEIEKSSTGSNSTNDIKFTINGTYRGITNFIYAIEDDTELNFRIQNFKLLPSNGNILEGTFRVTNVAIQGNTSTQGVTNTSQATNSTTDAKTNSVGQ